MAQVFPENPLAVVVGMAQDKEHGAVCAALRQAHPAIVVFTSSEIGGGSARCALSHLITPRRISVDLQ